MKTITAYLASAGITGEAVGPATTALQAMLTDAQSEVGTANGSAETARTQVQTEIRENQQARALAASFRKVAEKAGVDLSPLSDTSMSAERRRELSDDLGAKVLEFVSGASESAQDAAGILKAAGFDLDAYQKAGKDKRGELARAFTEDVTGSKAKLASAERERVYTDLKLDPKKTARVLGDVTLEKGKVTVKGKDGNPAEVEAWGTKGADGAFTSVEKLVSDAGWTMQELAPRAQDSNASGQSNTATEQPLGWLLNDGQTQASGNQSGGLLDFLTPAASTETKT